MSSSDLGDWTLTPVGGPIPADMAGRTIAATVPGTVHTDLLAAGLIPHPYADDNERRLTWIGRCDWEYRTTFAWSPDGHDRHDLVFDGLDTIARVRLNGRPIAETANQHRTYRIGVDEVLVQGRNDLVVTFGSPVRYADEQSVALGARPHTNSHPFNAIRKAAYSFGWDWGPDMATTGIWRAARLHAWSTARLAQVRPVVTVEGATGHVAVYVELEIPDGGPRPVALTVRVGEVETETLLPPGVTATRLDVAVPDVSLWWPRGYGDQSLYPLTVTVRSEGELAGEVSDRWTGRVGFRTVRVDNTADEYGTAFTLVVNDQPIFARGANWIPDDVFLPRVDRDRCARRIAQAEQANLNVLRVWGGGVYEADHFYDLCDEHGILTWQDFLFACAAYAEEEPLRGEVEAEARDNIARLMSHPSLVLWTGGNETIVGRHHWGWQPRLDGRSWGEGYYTDLLPSLVAELDPYRPYVPSSPWSGTVEADPHDHDHGLSHLWQPWNRLPYSAYRESVPRFVAEFGWQGPPTWATLRRAISDDPLTPESPGMVAHQKAWKGNDKLTDGLVRHLRVPDDIVDWHWAMSLNQAAAVRFGIHHFRSWAPRCAGALVWQLNDCWPATSWSAIDGDGRPKPLLYAMARAFADRLLTVQPRGGGVAVAIVNDSPNSWTGRLSVERRTYAGGALAEMTREVIVPAREVLTVPVAPEVACTTAPARELLLARLGDERTEHFYTEYRDSALESPRFTCEVVYSGGVHTVHIRADNLIRDLTILPDRLHPEARVDTMLTTLLPGEHLEIRVTAPEGVDLVDFNAPGALRSANELVTGSGAIETAFDNAQEGW